nr:uncharacterized protein LOC123287029 isoform X2 [Equus asinus]
MQNSRIFVVQPSRASILLSDFEEQNLSNLHGLQAAATSGPVLANKVRTALREQVEWKLDPAAAVGKTNGPPRRIYDPLPERTRIPEVLLLRAQSRGFISPLLGCPPSGWPEISFQLLLSRWAPLGATLHMHGSKISQLFGGNLHLTSRD